MFTLVGVETTDLELMSVHTYKGTDITTTTYKITSMEDAYMRTTTSANKQLVEFGNKKQFGTMYTEKDI